MEKLYLSGAGEMFTKISGGSLLKFGTIIGLSLSTAATFKELFAGKGMFPVASRAFEKTIEASADIAEFDKNFLEISQGLVSSDPSTVDRYESGEVQTVAAGTITVSKSSYKSGYTYITNAAGDKLSKVSGAPASISQYQESDPATGEITLHADLNDVDVYVSYVYVYDYSTNADNVELAVVAADVLPSEFQLWYKCEITEGGVKKGVEIMFFKCRPTTDMKLNFARDFVLPNFTFKILDPNRGDGRIGHYLIY